MVVGSTVMMVVVEDGATVAAGPVDDDAAVVSCAGLLHAVTKASSDRPAARRRSDTAVTTSSTRDERGMFHSALGRLEVAVPESLHTRRSRSSPSSSLSPRQNALRRQERSDRTFGRFAGTGADQDGHRRTVDLSQVVSERSGTNQVPDETLCEHEDAADSGVRKKLVGSWGVHS